MFQVPRGDPRKSRGVGQSGNLYGTGTEDGEGRDAVSREKKSISFKEIMLNIIFGNLRGARGSKSIFMRRIPHLATMGLVGVGQGSDAGWPGPQKGGGGGRGDQLRRDCRGRVTLEQRPVEGKKKHRYFGSGERKTEDPVR